MGWRDLLPDLLGRRRDSLPDDGCDPFERPAATEASEPDRLTLMLGEIEAGALAVYAANGLPHQSGHYRRAPNETEWRFIGAELPPEKRFALTLEHPPEQGWRFARLQDLGARSEREELRAASRLLNDIAELRLAGRGMLTSEHLLMAMELGEAWRALQDVQAIRSSHLHLSAPRKTRARRDKPVSGA